MPQKCSKRFSAFTWALFECMFFSSVVLGWTWLSIVFRSDGYFTETCNVTFVNATPPGGGGFVGVDQRFAGSRPVDKQPRPRTRIRKRPCRIKRDPWERESTEDKNSLGLNEFAATAIDSHVNGTPFNNRFLVNDIAFHAKSNAGGTSPREIQVDAKISKVYRAARQVPNGLALMNYLTDQKDDINLSTKTSNRFAKSVDMEMSEPSKPEDLETVEATGSEPLQIVQLQLGAETHSLGRYKRDRQYETRVGYGDDETYPSRPATPKVIGYCVAQNEKLRLMFALVLIIRDLLTFPMGAFYDKHGTTKTRLLTVLIFALGTLMMIFTSYHIPWLVVPALALTAIAGSAVLLTNLQTANLFGRKRHLVVSLYVGAAYSDGIITLLMQLSHFDGVNLQTSFMFLTIGIVPLLVSTVAFLPKTRIPWPLPADYGKRRNKSLDEDVLRKQRAWQRRMSEDPDLDLAPHLFPDSSPFTEVNGGRCRKPPPDFTPLATQSLFVVSCLWFGVHRLHEAVFDYRVVDIGDMELLASLDFETLYGVIQLMAVFVSPLAGLLIDRHMPRELGSTQATQQMRRIIPSIAVTSSLGVAQVVIDMFEHPVSQSLAAVVNLLHKVFVHTTMCAFVMHIHFNHQHLGKYYGLTCAVGALIAALQFPVRIFLIKMTASIMPAHILLLVLGLLSFGHALNVWDQCRRRLIRDQSDRSSERFQAQASGGVVPLSVYIETDESNLPANNPAAASSSAECGNLHAENKEQIAGTHSRVNDGTSDTKEESRGNGKKVVVLVGTNNEHGECSTTHQRAMSSDDYPETSKCRDPLESEKQPVTTNFKNNCEQPVAMDSSVTMDASGEREPLAAQKLSPAQDEERNELEDIDDDDFDEEDINPSNMLEFVKL